MRDGAVERVIRDPFFKKGTPKEILVTRVVKKQKVLIVSGRRSVIGVETIREDQEPSIENYPDLAEVFQKAA